MGQQYAVLVIQGDDESYVCQGLSNRVARFCSKWAAKEQAEFLQIGLDDGDTAIVVECPSDKELLLAGYDV